MEDTDLSCSEFSAILDIYVHHARNIHNICIYDNQDVYAKFSLTYNPDETLSTRIINGGGKNPVFDENLMMKVSQVDAVLKCEIWMLSRARNLMEDQLLGFALVPVSQIAGKGKVTEDYNLSSTELFHSPAGTVRLTLFLHTSAPLSPSTSSNLMTTSISSEVVILHRKSLHEEAGLDPVEFSRIEFPDIYTVRENEQMVTECFNGGFGSFLHLSASDDHDCEMGAASSSEERQHSMLLSSTITSLSDERNSGDSVERKPESFNSLTTTDSTNHTQGAYPETPTSRKEPPGVCKEEPDHYTNSGVNVEAGQAAMQQQIVDMYMRSMQQFTESLAKMKLPMDLGGKLKCEDRDDNSSVVQNRTGTELEKESKKKDGSRVFYGSRAFF